MTRRELNLAIFEGTADKVLWQPRLETWIEHHMKEDTMPERFRGMTNLEIYDELRCSNRYEACVGLEFYYENPDEVVTKEERRGDRAYETITTPAGSITRVHHEIWQDGKRTNRRIEKYAVTTPEELRVVIDIVERMRCRANHERHREAAERMGHRGEPTSFLTSSGFTDLIKEWAGLEDTFYLLADHPDVVEAYLEACDRWDDRVIDAALTLPFRIYNLGDHATNEFTPPPILVKYLLPRWQRISERLHQHNRFVHTHWDGNSITMLPYLKETGLDGVEALTPKPMGDMTLEDIKKAVGDTIVCLDLLPAIDFLEQRKTADMVEFAKRVIDMFAPRLILGISDEISQIGQIEKVEAISELVDGICGLAD
jgi:hypothetical protein